MTLHYTLVATNDGNVPLTGVSITDARLGALTCSPAQPATLAPAAALTCSGTYLTTQADVNAGRVDNTANASGTFGTTPVAAAPASASVPAVQTPHLRLTKAATETSFNAAGVTLHYTLVATNDGNVPLTGVSITDARLGPLTCNPTQPATLAPAAALTCAGTYLTTQADVNAGRVDNTANASGTFGTTTVAAAPASASVPAVQTPHLRLTKAATETSFNAAGVTLHYTLVATNDGNVPLTGVSITDARLGTLTCNPTQPATLAPAATLTCTGTYLTTQADVNAGRVDNTANASGTFGTTPVAAAPASASVPAHADAAPAPDQDGDRNELQCRGRDAALHAGGDQRRQRDADRCQHHRRQAGDAHLQPDPARDPGAGGGPHLLGDVPDDAGGCERGPGRQHRQRQRHVRHDDRCRLRRRVRRCRPRRRRTCA